MKRKFVIKEWQLFVMALAFAVGMISFMMAGDIGSNYKSPNWLSLFTDIGFVCWFVIGFGCIALFLVGACGIFDNEIKEGKVKDNGTN